MYNASSPPAWRAALTRKHNSIYDLVKSIAPRATVVQYGRGGLGRTVPDQIPIPSFHPSYPISADGWPTPFYSGYYTGDERVTIAINIPFNLIFKFNYGTSTVMDRAIASRSTSTSCTSLRRRGRISTRL